MRGDLKCLYQLCDRAKTCLYTVMLEPFMCFSTSCNLSLLFCKKTDQKYQPTEAFSCHCALYENTYMYYELNEQQSATSQNAQDVRDINQGKLLLTFCAADLEKHSCFFWIHLQS